MYSRNSWEKLAQQIQTILSQKQKKFCWIFIGFLQSAQTFPHFEEKDERHSLNISEVIDPDKYGYFNVYKLLF